jgi:phytol kinase
MIPIFWAEVLTFIMALGWLRLMDFIAQRGWIDSRLSRKIIHVGTGPIFVLCWLLYPDQPIARYLAALIPLLFTLQFALIGIGKIKDQATVDAICRTGDPREMLKGPLFYGIVFVMLTIIYWKDSPVGIIALMLICGGDGMADIMGSKYKSALLPWSKQKSLLGSTAMFLGGWIFSFGMIAVFISAGVFYYQMDQILLPITIMVVLGTMVESLPFQDIDNLTIPLVSMIAGYFLF